MADDLIIGNDGKARCGWVGTNHPIYEKYHDKEWGIPVIDDDVKLFEFLILEGAQAGLSWITILKKRHAYQKAFKNFVPQDVANMTDMELEELITNSDIVKNRLKIFSVRQNAKIFLEIQKEFGSFSNYIWAYVDKKPIVNNWQSLAELPTKTELSHKISKDLKKRGMNFVGPTIIYSYMQAIGVVNDHLQDCYLFKKFKN